MRICRITQTIKTAVDNGSANNERNLKNYSCSECGILLLNIEKFNEHNMTVHNPARCFNCDKCENIFSKKYMLVMHKISAHKEKGIQQSPKVIEICDKCEICFDNTENKIKHYNEHHYKQSVNEVEIVEEISGEYVVDEYPERKKNTENP